MNKCFRSLGMDSFSSCGGKNPSCSSSKCFGALEAFGSNGGKDPSSSASKCFGALEAFGSNGGKDPSSSASKCFDALEAFGSNGGKNSSTSEECKLPEELVEMIIARFPFPSILKFRCLSTTWLDNLSISREPRQREFQKQVASVSDRWPSYCPAFVVEGTILGYNGANQTWTKVVMHPMTVKHLVSTALCQRLRVYPIPVILFAGALVCQLLTVKHGCQVIVSNVLTGSSVYLPRSPPGPQSSGPGVTAVIGESRMFTATATGYEVLLVHTLIDEALERMPQYSLSLHIQHYSSQTNTWKEESVVFDPNMSYEQCIYLVKCCSFTDGTVFLLFFHEKYIHGLHYPAMMRNTLGVEMARSSLSLWSYGVESGQWTRYTISSDILANYDIIQAFEVSCTILKCGRRILMVDVKGGRSTTLIGGFWTMSIQFRVSELDLQTRRLEVVSKSPMIQVPSTTGTVSMKRATRFASDDRRVFINFRMAMALSIHIYDADEKTWSTSPCPNGEIRSLCGAQTWVETPFSPGSHTFSSV
ncbi:hypothetical protein R1flu_013453 [Riccia fluitans]|uniref:F-box domain-containing protein n=1 Tax=Riccia fluitans TaxID=41844 RepID=A0ABD1YGG5_9MARC